MSSDNYRRLGFGHYVEEKQPSVLKKTLCFFGSIIYGGGLSVLMYLFMRGMCYWWDVDLAVGNFLYGLFAVVLLAILIFLLVKKWLAFPLYKMCRGTRAGGYLTFVIMFYFCCLSLVYPWRSELSELRKFFIPILYEIDILVFFVGMMMATCKGSRVKLSFNEEGFLKAGFFQYMDFLAILGALVWVFLSGVKLPVYICLFIIIFSPIISHYCKKWVLETTDFYEDEEERKKKKGFSKLYGIICTFMAGLLVLSIAAAIYTIIDEAAEYSIVTIIACTPALYFIYSIINLPSLFCSSFKNDLYYFGPITRGRCQSLNK